MTPGFGSTRYRAGLAAAAQLFAGRVGSIVVVTVLAILYFSLKTDRFFTTDFTPEVYSPVGMRWIDDNGFLTVMLRHFPRLRPALRGVKNPFAPWPGARR